MNLVLDGAFEVDVKKGTRKEIGTCDPTNFVFTTIITLGVFVCQQRSHSIIFCMFFN